MITGPDHLIFIKEQSFTVLLLHFSMKNWELKTHICFYNRLMVNIDRREESMW